MPAERQSGSDRGRPLINWEQAFMHYASMAAPDRSYQAIADHYQVSVRTVERHGREQGWKQRLRTLQTEAAAAADSELSRVRAEKLADVEKLIDASLLSYAQQLQRGSVRVAPVDLQRLFKLRQQLWDEETAASAGARANQEPEEEDDPQARKLAIVRALHEAGVFERLQALIVNDDDHNRRDGSPPAAGVANDSG